MPGRGSATPTKKGVGSPLVDWAQVAASAPDALAVIDADGRFAQLNDAAVALLLPGSGCRDAGELIGAPAPFPRIPAGLAEQDPGERVSVWTPAAAVRREFAYRVRPLPSPPGAAVVAFRDVTAQRHQERRVAAIARTSATLASAPSITAMLDGLAHEVVQADALAAVQIFAFDGAGRNLQIMGSAGFRRWPDFFERLMRCRDLGATLHMLDALDGREPVVVPHRWAMIEGDPAWEPLRDYLSELEWDSFASVPLTARGRAQGVMNAFFAPGQDVGPATVEFLVAMAEQAAVAIDYAALLHSERELARREERQRLARDLHDSIVQQVFSVGMQAKSLTVLGGRGEAVPAANVQRIAGEIEQLSKTVLADLRAMVHELRPPASPQLGLGEAVRALVESTGNRTGLRFDLEVGDGLADVGSEIAEDAYRIVAEAIHNVVKHAEARTVAVRVGVRGRVLTVSVADDGRGLPAQDAGRNGGYGVTSMRERAERWGGTLRVRQRPTGGTSVRAVVPLPVSVPHDRPENRGGDPCSTAG
ncbi:MAG TPA: histidine kinase [Pseudonocardia sp.]|uniref:histidine kinase n=1 Tax=Pseudonocardia sp. TaxID=60912 RepID=UPI002B4AFCA9|nr:histidine kinase [Pseudonocardia sp.]HLU54063.1 histidine kinase [Pseudonocardia sp.]